MLKRLPALSVIALAWLSLLAMNRQHGPGAMHHAPVDAPGFLLLLAMWWCMAVAMMLPTALPALAVLQDLDETARRKGTVTGRPMLFALGFILAWLAFGLAAAVLQISLHHAALLSPAGRSSDVFFTALLFVLAGIYQWTPLKQACVSKCRSPLAFFLSFWQEGNRGYTVMGLRMGKYCLGCCWAMMLLMFAVGAMNLLWMGLLTVYMYAEKNWLRRAWLDRLSGLVLAAVGVIMLLEN